jgi:SAM-dependent methyltransferase
VGIPIETIKLLAKILHDKSLSGDVITYGVQGVDITNNELIKLLEKSNVKYRSLDHSEIRTDPKTQYGDTVAQDTFFKTLGCAKVDSIDLRAEEDPSFLLDLNKPIPERLFGQYDVVWDGGTMEHCLDVKEVLSNCVRLLRKGGMVVHNNPISGWINHGFYQFSPTLYFDFYSRNGFSEMEMIIQFGTRYLYYNSDLVAADLLNQAGLILFFARKKEDVGEIVIPNQGYYLERFGKRCDETKVEGGDRDKATHNSRKALRKMMVKYVARGRILDCWLKLRMLKYVLEKYHYFRGVVDRHQELIKKSEDI